jgi:hypothetical protein
MFSDFGAPNLHCKLHNMTSELQQIEHLVSPNKKAAGLLRLPTTLQNPKEDSLIRSRCFGPALLALQPCTGKSACAT